MRSICMTRNALLAVLAGELVLSVSRFKGVSFPAKSNSNLNLTDISPKTITSGVSGSIGETTTSSEKSNSKDHGFIGTGDNDVITVVAFPYIERGITTSSSKQMIEDGISESGFLSMSHNINDFDSTVWLIDSSPVSRRNEPWCKTLNRKVAKAQKVRKEQGQSLQWPIRIINLGDRPFLHRCRPIFNEVRFEDVRYSQRSIVSNRHYNETIQWVTQGEKLPIVSPSGGVQHSPISVRTDIVQTIDDILREQGRSLADPIESLNRSLDVAHFWQYTNRLTCVLRNQINKILKEYCKESGCSLKVGLEGDKGSLGRQNAQSGYVKAMLDSKIVVVTQRDDWEDHYRLFEALVTGTLVLTDRMLSLPKGLKDGISIVEYSCADDLKSKLAYYLNHSEERLEVARRGREVAMSRHRSWHRMEEIIFGRIRTTCRRNDSSSCPYIVHANETNAIATIIS